MSKPQIITVALLECVSLVLIIRLWRRKRKISLLAAMRLVDRAAGSNPWVAALRLLGDQSGGTFGQPSRALGWSSSTWFVISLATARRLTQAQLSKPLSPGGDGRQIPHAS